MGDRAEAASSRHAATMGRIPPWYLTVFSLSCNSTPTPARSAPLTIASACSSEITLKLGTARPRATASAMRVAVGTSVTARPPG
jgi:hypothetical protein